MEFVAYKENLDSFLVEAICLLALRQCNTMLLIEYASLLYLHHQAYRLWTEPHCIRSRHLGTVKPRVAPASIGVIS